MEHPPGLGQLDSAQWDALQERFKQFQDSWAENSAHNASIDLESFLPPPTSSMRRPALEGLVIMDIEARLRRGRAVDLSTYCRQFPELGDFRRPPVSLVAEEFRTRRRLGLNPDLSEFTQRYPHAAETLERLLVEASVPTIAVPSEPETAPPNAATIDAPTLHTDMAKATRAVRIEPLPTPRSSVRSAPVMYAPGSSADVVAVGGGYRKITRIGAGSYGEVWRAEAPGGVEVAMKIIMRPLDHIDAQRELQSLELIKGLRHPFLLATQSFWSLEDRLLIVMELADGSLRDLLKESKARGEQSVPAEKLLQLFREAAEGLDYLHANQLHHRDVKPDNILFLQGHAKVADFGLAKLRDSVQVHAATTAGSPGYMAPEVWRGQVFPASDQYGLACTYAELRLGRPIVTGNSMVELMIAHLESIPDLGQLDEGEAQVLRRALDKDPKRRFASCVEFVEALQAVFAPPPPVEEPPKPLWVRWLRGAALTAILVAVTVTVVLLLRPDADPPPPDIWLPDQGRAAAGASIVDVAGRKWYDRIEVEQFGQTLEYVLIPRSRDGDPPTFYMMRDKVWNGLFAPAWDDPECQKRLDELRQRWPWSIKDQWRLGGERDEKPIGVDEPRHPVFRVTVMEAYCVGRTLGGLLPTREQWWKAAGRGESETAGPFQCRDDIAVNRRKLGPMLVGTSKCDVSRYGCRDMAGNGLEWTRTTLDGPIPLNAPQRTTLVTLAGRSYLAQPEPLPFLTPEEEESEQYDFCGPALGFRLVIEP